MFLLLGLYNDCDYSHWYFMGCFLTREDAVDALAKINANPFEDYYIKEITIGNLYNYDFTDYVNT